MTHFAEKMIVSYQEMTGTIRFIGNQYLVLELPPSGVGVLIYREDWKNIELMNGNQTNRK